MAGIEQDNPFRSPAADSYRQRASATELPPPPGGILATRWGPWLLWAMLALAAFGLLFTARQRRPPLRPVRPAQQVDEFRLSRP
jgi:hypothetical protein